MKNEPPDDTKNDDKGANRHQVSDALSNGDRIIPCGNLSPEKQMEMNKAIYVRSSGKDGVSADDIASMIDVSRKNVAHCVSFWKAMGFVSGKSTKLVAEKPLIDYFSEREWGRLDIAREILFDMFRHQWFGEIILARFKMQETLSENELETLLGRSSGYNINTGVARKRIKYLVGLLEIAGVITGTGQGNYTVSELYKTPNLPEKSQHDTRSKTQSSIILPPKDLFEVGRIIGRLETGINGNNQDSFNSSIEVLKQLLKNYPELSLLVDSLCPTFEYSIQEANSAPFEKSLKFVVEKMKDRLALGTDFE